MREGLQEIGAADSVREILARHPQTAAVFERHGLLGCGGTSGPDERLDLFAAVHRVPLPDLLAELRQSLGAPAAAPEAASDAEAQAATLYRRFLRAALICTLTLGATFGAYNLLVIQLALGELPVEHNWVHASFQLFGFVLLFLMGVGYHALPRFLGTSLRHLPLARGSFALALAGLLLRSYGQFGRLLPWTAPSLLAGALLQLAALLCFTGVLASTYRAARPAWEPFHGYLAAGLLGWLVAGSLLVAEGLAGVAAGDAGAGLLLHEPLYLAALLGGTLPFIEGFVLRTGPAFLNLPAPRRGAVTLAFWLGQAGSLSAVAGAGWAARGGSTIPFDLGLLATGGALVAFLWAISAFRAGRGPGDERDPAFPRILRQAFGWAAVAAVLGGLAGALDLAGLTAPSLLFDGFRHAFALGFVTLMIFGMASRIVPIFGGTSLRWPALRTAGTWLISGGVLLRELEVVASTGAPWLLHLSACSGVVAAAGVALASASLLATLGSAAKAAPVSKDPVAVDEAANVHELVATHPEALAVLIRAGFTPLANPVARQLFARAVSLRQACRMHGRDAAALVAELRAACTREHLRPAPEPPAAPPAPEPPAPPLAAIGAPLDGPAVLEVLRGVIDPELRLNVVDLGLVYGVDILGPGSVRVRLTLTSPHCPNGAGIAGEIEEAVQALPGVEEVDVALTFEPPWSPARLSSRARAELGLPAASTP